MNILIVFLLIVLSCDDSSQRIVNDTFSNKYKLNPIQYKVDEIIKPVDIVILDDYLIIMNEIMPEENIFFVYSLSSFKFYIVLPIKGVVLKIILLQNYFKTLQEIIYPYSIRLRLNY